MSELEQFCRQVRARSDEHHRAIKLMYDNRIMSQVVSILRQEVDSMIRVVYLLSLTDDQYRQDLIRASVNGERWKEKGKNRYITDADMVKLTQKLKGWTRSVYHFGCAFIHLSNFHDYQERNPLNQLPDHYVSAIDEHLQSYHQFSLISDGGDIKDINELLLILPMVFEKIRSNLAIYVRDLEEGKNIDVRS